MSDNFDGLAFNMKVHCADGSTYEGARFGLVSSENNRPMYFAADGERLTGDKKVVRIDSSDIAEPQLFFSQNWLYKQMEAG